MIDESYSLARYNFTNITLVDFVNFVGGAAVVEGFFAADGEGFFGDAQGGRGLAALVLGFVQAPDDVAD